MGGTSGRTVAQRRAAQATHARNQRLESLRWLLAFTNAELPPLTPTDCREVNQALERLVRSCLGQGGVLPARWLPRAGKALATPAQLRMPRMSRARIRNLHTVLRNTLTELRPDDESGADTVPYVLLPAGVQGVVLTTRGKGIERVYGAGWPDLVWLAIAATFEAFGEQIRRCPSCERWFLRHRRQAYCSPQCSQKVRSRNWYREHRDEAQERRRCAYMDEVKAKYPKANVRVSARKRT